MDMIGVFPQADVGRVGAYYTIIEDDYAQRDRRSTWA
jgi:hypothetical protein